MATVEENRGRWDGSYGWKDAGDEWSAPWGDPSVQWFGTILPRIHRFLPTGAVLEIGCGYGRWTRYLKDRCERLSVVDLSERCVEACRQRFADCDRIAYFVNDGKSLDMIPDHSVDFVFSFDSLVHADESVLDAYLAHLPRILKDDGAAFVHHSNLGEYPRYRHLRRVPRLRRLLRRVGLVEHLHLRDYSVTAAKVANLAERHGLRCISQEIIPWLTRRTLIDCLSTIVPGRSAMATENRVVRNTGFADEVRYLSSLSKLYAPVGRSRTPNP